LQQYSQQRIECPEPPHQGGNMETNTKSVKSEAETIKATFCPAAYASLFSKGLKRVVEVSKTFLDLGVEQNTEVLASYKEPGF
jgi:hypothetical protein